MDSGIPLMPVNPFYKNLLWEQLPVFRTQNPLLGIPSFYRNLVRKSPLTKHSLLPVFVGSHGRDWVIASQVSPKGGPAWASDLQRRPWQGPHGWHTVRSGVTMPGPDIAGVDDVKDEIFDMVKSKTPGTERSRDLCVVMCLFLLLNRQSRSHLNVL